MDRKPAVSRPKALPSRTDKERGDWALLTILTIATFLPTFVFFVFRTSSPAAGLVAGCLMVLGMILLGAGKAPTSHKFLSSAAMIVLIIFLILAHASLAAFVDRPNVSRTVSSALGLGTVFLTALLIDDTMFKDNNDALRWATNVVRGLFIVLAALALVGIGPAGEFDKPVFPFTEPSHYALAFTPFLIDGCVRSSGWKRLSLLAISLGIAIVLESLSLIVGITLAALISLPFLTLAMSAVGAYFVSRLIDLTYFLDRLDLNYDSGNLSTLVYIQGWELVYDSLTKSNGWGIGFQQLGFTPINSPTADRIVLIFGTDYNIQDGGFTASKLLSELGVFALCLLISYLTIFLFAAIALRRHVTRSGAQIDSGQILAYSFICGLFVEIFVRGGGYFSGTVFFAVSALAYIARRNPARGRWKQSHHVRAANLP